jgi:hypothetical protein
LAVVETGQSGGEPDAWFTTTARLVGNPALERHAQHSYTKHNTAPHRTVAHSTAQRDQETGSQSILFFVFYFYSILFNFPTALSCRRAEA